MGASIPAEPPRRPISIAIDPVTLVVSECITVTSAMRKHARWAHSSVSAILAGGGAHRLLANSDSRSIGSGSLDDKNPLVAAIQDDGNLQGRWGLHGKKGSSMQDNPLLSAFARLRSDMKHVKDIQSVDTVAILHPFMQVIRSSSTTAPITSLALIAITKMLSYNIISESNPNFAKGLQLLSLTVTHCRFESENNATDEIVFLRILRLIEILVTGPSGNLLCDKSICDMMSCVLNLSCVSRVTEAVRRAAEIAMVTMCQVIFQRLRSLDMESDGILQDPVDATKEELDRLTIDDSELARQASDKQGDITGPNTPRVESDAASASFLPRDSKPTDKGETAVGDISPESADIRPYALPAIRELFRVLADLLDPFKRERTDTMRIIALRIVNVALEVAGPSIALQPSLASLAKDALCRNLFELVRSENVAILHESLRVTGTLLATCRTVLKLQQDLYLSYVVTCLHPRVPIPEDPTIEPALYDGVPQGPHLAKPVPGAPSSGRATPVPVKERQRLGMEGGSRKPDARESMVESVGALVRIPSFMPELFVNYDCEIDGAYLCLDMVGLLARNAFPDSATWSTTNVPPLCLDSLLTYVQFIADRLEDEPITKDLPDPAMLRTQRAKKTIVVRGVQKFNENPTAGIAFLASQGIIDSAENPVSIAKFLKGTTRIDKTVLGEFISKLKNYEILKTFLDLFDFEGLRVDQALRLCLNSFRLPGEAPLIERIVTVFAEKVYRTDSETWANGDVPYILAYAVIMLNTDQHNRNVKDKRMTAADFAKNLRGVNGGKDFAQEYLREIYDSIRTHEIILPEEHDTKHASDHAWSELLIKAQTATDLTICNTNIYDADMFEATWRPVVATLNYVFMSATDDAVFSRVTAGFHQCAQIAAKYGIYDCLDTIVTSLARISTLATETPPSTNLNTEVQANGKSIMVSKFAVDFGREQRAQMAMLILFRIINGQEHAIRDGWAYLVRILINLYTNSLIPNPLASLSRRLDLPSIPLQSPSYVTSRVEKSADSGLFSVFTSYVSSVMNDEPPEPNDQEIEATVQTIETVNACRVEEVVAHIDSLPISTLKALTSSVVNLLPGDASPRVIAVKSEVSQPTPVRPNGVKTAHATYDPAQICLLELLTVMSMRDPQAIELFGADVARVLMSSLRNVDKLHHVAVSRLSYYLLSLVKASSDHDYLRAPVILHHIASFTPELLKQSANNILKGLLECMSVPGLRNELGSSPDFWSLLHSLRALPDGAPLAFRIIDDIASGSPPAISADNYEPAVALLNAFATAGGELPSQDQLRGQQQQQQRRGRQQQQMPLASPTEKPARSDTVLRGVSAMQILLKLTTRVPTLIKQSQLEPHAAWATYWHPVFRVLGQHCLNPARDIRQSAFAALQRILLSSDLSLATEQSAPGSRPGSARSQPETRLTSDGKLQDQQEWENVFGVVLDLLRSILRNSEVVSRDPRGMAEMRLQVAQLICKLFLHYLSRLEAWDGLADLWSNILGALGECISNKAGIAFEEEVLPEALKNVLLVMSAGRHLVPPPSDKQIQQGVKDDRTEVQRRMWTDTSQTLAAVLPQTSAEIFPDAAADESAASPSAGEQGSGTPNELNASMQPGLMPSGETNAETEGTRTSAGAQIEDVAEKHGTDGETEAVGGKGTGTTVTNDDTVTGDGAVQTSGAEGESTAHGTEARPDDVD